MMPAVRQIPYLRRLSLDDLEAVVDGLGRAVRSLEVSAAGVPRASEAAALLLDRIRQLEDERQLVGEEALRRRPSDEREADVRGYVLAAAGLLD